MSLLTCRRRGVGKSLPYDAEVEYLYFNGNCSINTNYVPFGGDIRIKTKVKFVGYTDSSSYIAWFKAYTNEDTGAYRIFRSSNSNTGIIIANGNKAGQGGAYFTAAANTIYEIDINRNSCKINNTSQSLYPVSNILNTGKLYIGTEKVKLYYYYFQLYKNDNLILDLIPVRIGQVGYMYNKVNSQLFGNDLTGSFILGNDV